MTTISFKAEQDFKQTLEQLARSKGINTSAYLKLVLTEVMQKELSRVTENGFTVAEELRILAASKEPTSGPFHSVSELIADLEK